MFIYHVKSTNDGYLSGSAAFWFFFFCFYSPSSVWFIYPCISTSNIEECDDEAERLGVGRVGGTCDGSAD